MSTVRRAAYLTTPLTGFAHMRNGVDAAASGMAM
jgi:hypothetical protein